MKIKKMWIIVFMLVGLVGCSQTKENESTDFQGIDNSSKEIVTTNTTEVKNSENNTSEVSLGNWDGSTYKNDFLKLTYTLPENWIRYSDEEIMSLMNLGTELAYGDNDSIKKILELTSIYYLFAQNENNNSNVTVFSEKVIRNLTVEEYLEQMEIQLNAQQSFKYIVGEKSSTHINGIEYKTLEAKVDGFDMIQKYFIRKEGNFFIGIIVTSATGNNDEIEEIINCFE